MEILSGLIELLALREGRVKKTHHIKRSKRTDNNNNNNMRFKEISTDESRTEGGIKTKAQQKGKDKSKEKERIKGELLNRVYVKIFQKWRSQMAQGRTFSNILGNLIDNDTLMLVYIKNFNFLKPMN